MQAIVALDAEVNQSADHDSRRVLCRLHGGGAKLDDEAALAITAGWVPYRSVGSWYLWRIADNAALGS